MGDKFVFITLNNYDKFLGFSRTPFGAREILFHVILAGGVRRVLRRGPTLQPGSPRDGDPGVAVREDRLSGQLNKVRVPGCTRDNLARERWAFPNSEPGSQNLNPVLIRRRGVEPHETFRRSLGRDGRQRRCGNYRTKAYLVVWAHHQTHCPGVTRNSEGQLILPWVKPPAPNFGAGFNARRVGGAPVVEQDPPTGGHVLDIEPNPSPWITGLCPQNCDDRVPLSTDL